MNDSRIVIVDDERIVTSAFKTLLKVEGFSGVECFNSPFEALEYLKNNSPDLVVSDFLMPDMNGLDATRIIKEVNRNIPIIALSAYAFDENIKEAKEAGCDDFMAKPFRVEDLLDKIQKYLKN